jgi:hypothetical protein
MSTSRRCLLASSLARLIQKERGGGHILEGYFPEQAGRCSCERIDGRSASLLLITDGPDGSVTEHAVIPRAHAEALLAVTAGGVDYIRTSLSVGPQEVHINHFLTPGPLETIDVAFGSVQEARTFQPLPWFGPEVSTDPHYGNPALALAGLAPVPEVPLTDAALNSLLDTLENRFAAPRPQSRRVVPGGLGPRQAEDTSSSRSR